VRFSLHFRRRSATERKKPGGDCRYPPGRGATSLDRWDHRHLEGQGMERYRIR
jgi:hypothetical protein